MSQMVRLCFTSKISQMCLSLSLLHIRLCSAHILPLLLNLLESRELHVRMTLLAYLPSFACVIPQQELVSVVLPEVLIGLNDTRGELVSATLHTLAEMVPLIGPEAVIGTTRRQVFVDSQPRVRMCKCVCVCVCVPA